MVAVLFQLSWIAVLFSLYCKVEEPIIDIKYYYQKGHHNNNSILILIVYYNSDCIILILVVSMTSSYCFDTFF